MADYDYGVPYDPDMSVHEALAAGLIGIIDSGTIATGNYEPCDYAGPFKPQTAAHYDPSRIRCTRRKGHHGMHAHITRWEMSQQDHEQILRQQKRLRADQEQRDRERLERVREHQADIQRAAAKMAEKLGVLGTDIQKAMEPMAKSMADLDKELHKTASQSYSPLEGYRKNARFRDKSVGKVRGR